MAPGSSGIAANASVGGPPGTSGFGSYYPDDGGYSNSPPVSKLPVKKQPMHQGIKPPGTGPAPGTFQNTPSSQSSFGQNYGQNYGQGKKNFNQGQGGASGGGGGGGSCYSNYSTSYPPQATGGSGNQNYGFEGELILFIY